MKVEEHYLQRRQPAWGKEGGKKNKGLWGKWIGSKYIIHTYGSGIIKTWFYIVNICEEINEESRGKHMHIREKKQTRVTGVSNWAWSWCCRNKWEILMSQIPHARWCCRNKLSKGAGAVPADTPETPLSSTLRTHSFWDQWSFWMEVEHQEMYLKLVHTVLTTLAILNTIWNYYGNSDSQYCLAEIWHYVLNNLHTESWIAFFSIVQFLLNFYH